MLNANITIQSLNDEPPRITGTPAEQTYLENAGPINIVENSTLIVDADNLFEHRVIRVLWVTLDNPVPGEDLLIAGNDSDASALSFSCDMQRDPACYDAYLGMVQYNNGADEPNSTNRIITIEVYR